jgi:MoxR-like ATPase
MIPSMMMIRNKSVQISPPYDAQVGEIVGRDREMREVLAAWMGRSGRGPLAPLLVGEPGLGKNRVVYECSKLCGKELYIVQGHEDVTAEDLICSVRFSDDPDRRMDYIVSPLVTAMLRGGICFIDEIGKIRLRALAPLASVLDERRYLDSILLGERIPAHPGFRFIAATNNDDFDESPLPGFLVSRLRPVITLGFPERDEIDKIIRSSFAGIQDDGARLLDRFWELWKQTRGDQPATPRDSLYIFSYALNLSDFDSIDGHPPYDLEARSGSFTVAAQHLERAFEAFGRRPGRANHVSSTSRN